MTTRAHPPDRLSPPAPWRERVLRSGYFVGAVLFHAILFLLVATLVVFHSSAPDQRAVFSAVPLKIPIPPPPASPPPAGGQAANPLEPSVETTPPPVEMAIISVPRPENFAVTSVKVQMPNLSSFLVKPIGSALSGATASGMSAGAGLSPFGSESGSGATALQGTLYDFKQTPERKSTGMTPITFHRKLVEFVAANWDPALLASYYKCSRLLNTYSIFIPTLDAVKGPQAFGVEKEVQPKMYAIWYKATITPPREGTYHFVGVGDDVLVVRVNGKVVLDGSLAPIALDVRPHETGFRMVDFKPSCSSDSTFYVGIPFQVSAGEPVDLDILIAEQPGGWSNYFLFIERDGASYGKQSNGTPLLPIFQLDSNPIHPDAPQQSYPHFAPTPEPWGLVAK